MLSAVLQPTFVIFPPRLISSVRINIDISLSPMRAPNYPKPRQRLVGAEPRCFTTKGSVGDTVRNVERHSTVKFQASTYQAGL